MLITSQSLCGCDSCSAFKGKRKVASVKLLNNVYISRRYLVSSVNHKKINYDVPEVLEEFMSAMYGNALVKCVNDTLSCWLSVVAKGEAE